MPALILIPSLCYQGQGKRDAKEQPFIQNEEKSAVQQE